MCFKTYLNRIGKSDWERCPYCVERDTPEHVILECVRWMDEREHMYQTIGIMINIDELMGKMLESGDGWSRVTSFIILWFSVGLKCNNVSILLHYT